MVEQIIHLEPEDDHYSIRDRIEWARANRILLVLPPSREPIRDRLGLVLLQRHAGRLGLEVALVTTNPSIVSEARDLGIAVFPSPEIGRSRRDWRWPWRPASRPSAVPTPSRPDAGDLREMMRRSRPRPAWMGWINRLSGLVAFVLVLATLLVGGIYLIPGATVTLHPATHDLSVTTIVVGDPSLEEADYAAGRIPARVVRVAVNWRGSAATTGFTDVPDSLATGTVVFINQSAAPVTVPAGTVVRTSAGTTIRFRTTRTVEIASAAGATAEAPVVALDAGPWGNIGPNLINQVEGALALQLRVRNLAATEGGGVRQVKAVTQADLDRLRGQVLQQLFQLAKADLPNWMTASEFLAEESLALFVVQREDYNRYVGEQADSLELEMSALIQGIVVDSNLGYGVMYTQLAAATPPHYRLIPESIGPPRRGDVVQVDDSNRVTFLMQGRARVAAEIDQGHIVEMIRGQPIREAAGWILKQIPVDRAPVIQVWPRQFSRLPYLSARITTRVETSG